MREGIRGPANGAAKRFFRLPRNSTVPRPPRRPDNDELRQRVIEFDGFCAIGQSARVLFASGMGEYSRISK